MNQGNAKFVVVALQRRKCRFGVERMNVVKSTNAQPLTGMHQHKPIG